ncbi:MAG: VanW family protein [Candidatus Levyibacteriota bacterium]
MRFVKNRLMTLTGFLFLGNTLIFGVPVKMDQEKVISSRSMSLEKRYNVPSVNEVMKENILLTLAYLRGVVKDPQKIDWQAVNKPFSYSFTLKPGETYAFQKDSLPEFTSSVKVTTDLHFASQEGFLSDGYLFGDGVCHLASLFYWAAKDANLTAVAPTNHNFATIPEIPREYGVAIYSQPNEHDTNAHQNLYVQNNENTDVKFQISFDGKELGVKVLRDNGIERLTRINQEII